MINPLRQASRSNLVAVASRTAKAAQDYATEWQIPQAFESYEAMLASSDINAVYIPLPNHLHHPWTIKAAEAGKHILCEKPLALTPQEVDEMAQAAKANNVVLFEAFMYRMHPQLAKVKMLIKEGLIGTVKLIKARFSFTVGPAHHIRLDKTMGGGSLWDVGCYPVSFAQAIMDTNPVEVFAWQVLGESGVDMVFTGQLKFANGVMAQIDSGFVMPYRVGAEIVGDKGVLYMPNPWLPDVEYRKSGIIHIAPDDTETAISVSNQDPYLCQVEVMEKAVLDGEALPYTLTHSRGNVATINALYQSAKTSSVVKIA